MEATRNRRHDTGQATAGDTQTKGGGGGQGAQSQAASLPPPDLSGGPEPCRHTWGEPETVSFSEGSRDGIRVWETCQGFVRKCKKCGGYHLVYEGPGAEYEMP